MPIVLRHNPNLEINRVEYNGVLSAKDLHDHAAYNAANPIWLGFDCVSVIHDDVDPTAITKSDLVSVFATHCRLVEPLGLLIMRRCAWVCYSPVGRHYLTHWLAARGPERSLWADVRQFDTFEAAGGWLQLSPQDAATTRAGEDFAEIARFDSAAAPSR